MHKTLKYRGQLYLETPNSAITTNLCELCTRPNPHSTIPTPRSSSPIPEPRTPNPPPHRTGRPLVLNEAKRREICALVAGGCTTREAARYVHCSYQTIRREIHRNPQFQNDLRRSEMFAQLSPLRAMQHAAGTHWRAAAWMLERAYPDRFARRDPAAFGPRQARGLLHDVLNIMGSEVSDPFQRERIEKRLHAAFEYTIRTACDQRRTSRDLRTAMKFFEEKDSANDPLAQFGFPTPDYAAIFRPQRPATPPAGAGSQPPKEAAPTTGVETPPNKKRPAEEIDPSILAEFASALGGLR